MSTYDINSPEGSISQTQVRPELDEIRTRPGVEGSGDKRPPIQGQADDAGNIRDLAKVQFMCSIGVAEEIRALAGAERVSMAEVIRRALSLYRFVCRQMRDGKRLFIGTEVGTAQEVLVPH